MEPPTTKVHAAFETLLEEIESAIDLVNRSGAKAFEERDYDRARELLERVGLLTDFRAKVADLRDEWFTVVDVPGTGLDLQQMNDMNSEPDPGFSPISVTDIPATSLVETPVQRSVHSRLQRGILTPEAAYYQPILRALDGLVAERAWLMC